MLGGNQFHCSDPRIYVLRQEQPSMEIPAAIRQRLGGEQIESAVNLGDEDLICFTPTRTLLYSGEGLLSDESVEVYEHDLERLSVSRGRRKTAFTLEYVDRSEKFSVPRKRGDSVLERLLDGVLKATDVVGNDEEVTGVFRFSELTLVVTDERLLKHVGSYLWDPDYEEFPYDEVTGLAFEDGTVATQVVISTANSHQRIKAPNDQARIVKKTLQSALFAYHEVESLERLNELLQPAEPEDSSDAPGGADEFAFDDSIAPLVGTSDDEDADEATEDNESASDGEAEAAGTAADDEAEVEVIETATSEPEMTTERTGVSSETKQTTNTAADSETTTGAETTDTTGISEKATDSTAAEAVAEGKASDAGQTAADVNTDSEALTGTDDRQTVDPEDIEAIEDQLSALTRVVKKQHNLLQDQQETIDQLIAELRKQR